MAYSLVPLTIHGKRHKYRVTLDEGLTWDESIKSMVIKNNLGSIVYKSASHGNRVAILVNHLYCANKTVYVEHNGTQYIYVPSMDVLVSRATKKICWPVKSNPQRKAIVALAS
jgi:hypothetical protein